MPITIKKRVSLHFLGEEYQDAYFRFRALPVSHFEDFQKESEKIDEKKAISFLLDKLKENFVDGKCPNEDGDLITVVKEDLDSLDVETILLCWQTYTGQVADPKE